MAKPKVDLTLIKTLLSELESSLNKAEDIYQDPDGTATEYIIAMLKAFGVCAGLSQEATLVTQDINKIVLSLQNSTVKDDPNNETINSLLNLLNNSKDSN